MRVNYCLLQHFRGLNVCYFLLVSLIYLLPLIISFSQTIPQVPNVSLKAEAAAKRRATIRCAKELATPTALAAYRTLLVDLAQPAITGNYEPPSLSESELRMVDALLELLVSA